MVESMSLGMRVTVVEETTYDPADQRAPTSVLTEIDGWGDISK